jgi:ERF superfamily
MSVEQVPASIVKAICAIQSTMGAVAKSNRNQHGGYNFASADDIYAALTRKMGEVGLAIISLEDLCDIKRVEKDGKTSQWAHMEFSFVLATEDATWTDKRAKRTLYIQVTGAQTFQAAQSYAEKAYLRSLFKIPTGDLDLDSMPQADNEDDQIALAKPRKPKSSSAAKKDGTDDTFNEIIRHVKGATTIDFLEQIPVMYADEIGTLPRRWHDLYEDEYNLRASQLDPTRTAAE